MLFNKADNGAVEVKGLIGFIYKSQTFANLVTYIKIAERELTRLVGKEIMTLAQDHYNSDDYNNQQQDDPQKLLLDSLVEQIQLPLILNAYRRYAPNADLNHSTEGRTITVTAEVKPAFEWMLERDNKNLADTASEATDLLLEWLDEQAPIPYVPTLEEPEGTDTPNIIDTTWHASASYAATKDLFVNTTLEFDAVYPIRASRRLYLTMVPFIREVEQRHIVPVIKQTRYDAIKEMIRDSDQDDEAKRIIALAKVPIVLFTMSIALKRLSVELLPDSVVQSFTAMDVKQTKTAASPDRIGVSALLERDARRELIALQNYIASLTPSEATEEEETDTTQPFFMA